MTTDSETITTLDHDKDYDIRGRTKIGGLTNYWVRETAYIVNEMLYAIEQSKNPELTDEQRKGYAMRATYLRLKAKECIHNAYNDSNKEENEENE